MQYLLPFLLKTTVYLNLGETNNRFYFSLICSFKQKSISSEERSSRAQSIVGGDDIDIDANVQYAGLLIYACLAIHCLLLCLLTVNLTFNDLLYKQGF